jgi:hypothetical protein
MSWSTINNNRDTKALDRDGNPSIRVIETEEQNSNKINLIDIASTTVTYIGQAAPGSTSNQAVWRIQRVNIVGSSIEILYADSNDNFDNVWDDRGTLSYG